MSPLLCSTTRGFSFSSTHIKSSADGGGGDGKKLVEEIFQKERNILVLRKGKGDFRGQIGKMEFQLNSNENS